VASEAKGVLVGANGLRTVSGVDKPAAMTRLGVMGGTFDPIHYGHLVAAESARESFGLDRILFVPAGQPPHKAEVPVTAAEHRYAMTLLATASNPRFDVSRIELDRPGPSYTVDTITALRELHGPEAEIFFVTGADAIMEIFSWNRSDALLESCQFIAVTRPGTSARRLQEWVARLEQGHGRRFHRVAVPGVAISSTDIRQRVRDGRPIRYLVPEAVEVYIQKHRLYARA